MFEFPNSYFIFRFLTMAHKYNVKFPKRYLSCQGPNVLGTQFTSKCFSFDLCSAGSGAITEPVDVVPRESVKHQWLYGPATDLASRRVIYPCALFKCSIPCPCLRCRKFTPSAELTAAACLAVAKSVMSFSMIMKCITSSRTWVVVLATSSQVSSQISTISSST
jgi:hypothetical protein